QRYATKIAGLWRGLSEALDRLERLAADPAERLADPDELETLPRLQYTLHAASEIVAGIAPPADAEATHAELAAALAGARDATAAFTSSDFGRTFPGNGQGSDHGWGSHH